MPKLTADDLVGLDAYGRASARRSAPGSQRSRRWRELNLGPEMIWSFADRLTVRDQMQEMLHVAGRASPEGVERELEAYNPLIPDGENLKVTLLIDIADPGRLRRAAPRGVGSRCYLRVHGCAPVWAQVAQMAPGWQAAPAPLAHFLRFDLTPAMIATLRAGAGLAAGVDHPAYRHVIDPVSTETLNALIADFE
jgi:hypothetical protein